MTPDLLEQLLFGSEGTSLDFKQKQYPFENVPDEAKSELLKDILAFANAWRREDAYILIGVKEVKGGRAQILGTDEHFDDAQLQEFVSKKTNKPVSLSYEIVPVEGMKIGVIRIPIQERAFYLRNDFAKLRANTVYVRRGSSTDVASPDETTKMIIADSSLAKSQPHFDLQFARHGGRQLLGTRIKIHSKIIVWGDFEIPNLAPPSRSIGGGYAFVNPMDRMENNDKFWREAAAFIQFNEACVPVTFYLKNLSDSVAQDVRIEIEVPADMELICFDENEKEDRPKERTNFYDLPTAFIKRPGDPSIDVKTVGDHRTITVEFGKIQSQQQMTHPDLVFLCAKKKGATTLTATIYCDELKAPQQVALNVEHTCERVNLETWQELKDVIEKNYEAEAVNAPDFDPARLEPN